MITLPDFNKAFDYENNFYLSCSPGRIGKFIAHYELYKKIIGLSGAVVECGVFKGCSFLRWATFASILEAPGSRKLIGFDIFGRFPDSQQKEDVSARDKFVKEAGEVGIGQQQLLDILKLKKIETNVHLVEGDICKTVGDFVKKNSELRIALLHMDADNYEPSKEILKYLFPLVVKGGVVIFDEYGTYPGETKAVDEYFQGQDVNIQKFSFAYTPSFMVKQ